jgi:hypothetical protein
MDPEIEQYQQGIYQFIFSWIIQLNKKTGKNAEECSQEVVHWVMTLCKTILEEQRANMKKEDIHND